MLGTYDERRPNDQMTIRNIMYDWMEIPRDNAVLPDPLPIDEAGVREYWMLAEDGGEENRILRPGWTDSWSANEAGWAKNVVAGVQMDGARWNPSANQTELTGLATPTILAAIHVTFSSWVKAYKKSKKPPVDQSIVRQKQRRNGRKTQVSESLMGAQDSAYHIICRRRTAARCIACWSPRPPDQNGHS